MGPLGSVHSSSCFSFLFLRLDSFSALSWTSLILSLAWTLLEVFFISAFILFSHRVSLWFLLIISISLLVVSPFLCVRKIVLLVSFSSLCMASLGSLNIFKTLTTFFSRESNVWASLRAVSGGFFPLQMGRTFLFLCMPSNFLLKTLHSEITMWELWELESSPTPGFAVIDCWGYSYLFSAFAKLFLQKLYFLSCIVTELSVLLSQWSASDLTDFLKPLKPKWQN